SLRLLEEEFCVGGFVFNWSEGCEESRRRWVREFVTAATEVLERIRRLARNCQHQLVVFQTHVEAHAGGGEPVFPDFLLRICGGLGCFGFCGGCWCGDQILPDGVHRHRTER